MKINIDGKDIEVKPGVPFMSGGKTFGLCGKCYRIIRLDGWSKGVHFCKANIRVSVTRNENPLSERL